MVSKKVELNPNCSEATVRIRIDRLNAKEKVALSNMIEKWEQSEDWCDNTYWNEDYLFGIDMIIISGDFPYNFSETIEEGLNKLPFRNKIEEEWRDG